jgi:hypothetical protein
VSVLMMTPLALTNRPLQFVYLGSAFLATLIFLSNTVLRDKHWLLDQFVLFKK